MSPWIPLALMAMSALEAARLMHCSPQTARRRLEQAEYEIVERRQNCRDAVRVTLADGLVRQDISRRAWEDVALGLKKPADRKKAE